MGFEPTTPSLGTESAGRPARSTEVQARGTFSDRAPSLVHEVHGIGTKTKKFVPVVSPKTGARLLTVREVATALAVSTATVYSMVERGEIGHVRISNARAYWSRWCSIPCRLVSASAGAK